MRSNVVVGGGYVTMGIQNRNELTGAESQENADVAGLAGIVVSSEPSPSQSLMARELMEGDQAALAQVHRLLRPDERDLGTGSPGA